MLQTNVCQSRHRIVSNRLHRELYHITLRHSISRYATQHAEQYNMHAVHHITLRHFISPRQIMHNIDPLLYFFIAIFLK